MTYIRVLTLRALVFSPENPDPHIQLRVETFPGMNNSKELQIKHEQIKYKQAEGHSKKGEAPLIVGEKAAKKANTC